jgi:putative membrane protein
MKRLAYIMITVLAVSACTNSERTDRDTAATDTTLPLADTTNKAQVYTADVDLSGDEKVFLLNSSLSAQRMIAFANLAKQRAKNTDLRNQATKLAHQYNTMLMHLELMAKGKGISLNTAEKIGELEVLKKEQDASFDKLYTNLILVEHTNLIQQLDKGSKVANEDIRNFATNGLAIVNRNNSDIAKILK